MMGGLTGFSERLLDEIAQQTEPIAQAGHAAGTVELDSLAWGASPATFFCSDCMAERAAGKGD